MADTLRQVSQHERIEIIGLHVTIHGLFTPHLIRAHVEIFQKATQQNTTLQLLIQQTLKGWAESRLQELHNGHHLGTSNMQKRAYVTCTSPR